MMAGRYSTDHHSRYWSPENRLGYCKASTCDGILGTLEHMLVICPELEPIRSRLRQMMIQKSSQCSILYTCILEILSAPPDILYQFLLDPLGLPKIREIVGKGGAQYLNLIYYMSRTYVFYLHRQYRISRNKWFPRA